ncbi:hypothetical protein Tpet_0943 [Thermotoga petrophila RKU-1]|uniref:EF-hand domain-containing protein n=1 Tax=Thermotoga petrophila (strain ATCC BAA-488 / DSM 13995 / JCM 10881 / RKU-1) TaxID=390874 RepID=A5IL88_THEP1|nr:hypothetical protein [Thermotoga petrophila]ABQ46961.1 hypothetical protein Tpet_0943 [Thermotoga petrophila RKU-1]
MKGFFVLMLLLIGFVLFGANFSIPVIAGDVEVPVVMEFSNFLDLIPEDFEPIWDSIRIYFDGKEVPYQVEDVDENGRISAKDYLVFLAKGKGEIVLSDEKVSRPEYEKVFDVIETETGWKIASEKIGAVVNKWGLAKIIRYENIEGTILDEIGIARVSGWPESTFYVDGNLGNHYEETSGAFRIVSVKIIGAGPVATGIMATLASEKFKGLIQNLVVHIFHNGDILVDNSFIFENYADIMKLQTMVTRPLAILFEDTLHILPVFRRLIWADQLGITPYEYWLERNAVIWVDNLPYIVFPAKDSMKPLWWGATYIFASMERWRTNFSPTARIGVAEILPENPFVPSDYKKWLDGDTWIYESLEFRDGVFKWMPSEFEVYSATKGIYSMRLEDMPNRYKYGDVVRHLRLFSIYEANDEETAIRFLEKKSESFRNLKIGGKPFKEF